MAKSSLEIIQLRLGLISFRYPEPGNLDLHDFWIFGTTGNPYWWISIYHITFKNPRITQGNISPSYLGNLEFGNFIVFENLGI